MKGRNREREIWKHLLLQLLERQRAMGNYFYYCYSITSFPPFFHDRTQDDLQQGFQEVSWQGTDQTQTCLAIQHGGYFTDLQTLCWASLSSSPLCTRLQGEFVRPHRLPRGHSYSGQNSGRTLKLCPPSPVWPCEGFGGDKSQNTTKVFTYPASFILNLTRYAIASAC